MLHRIAWPSNHIYEGKGKGKRKKKNFPQPSPTAPIRPHVSRKYVCFNIRIGELRRNHCDDEGPLNAEKCQNAGTAWQARRASLTKQPDARSTQTSRSHKRPPEFWTERESCGDASSPPFNRLMFFASTPCSPVVCSPSPCSSMLALQLPSDLSFSFLSFFSSSPC